MGWLSVHWLDLLHRAAKADVDALVACGLLLPADAEKQLEALLSEALDWLSRGERDTRSAGEEASVAVA